MTIVVAEILSPQKVYTFSSIGDYSIPKIVKCAHSATNSSAQVKMCTRKACPTVDHPVRRLETGKGRRKGSAKAAQTASQTGSVSFFIFTFDRLGREEMLRMYKNIRFCVGLKCSSGLRCCGLGKRGSN